MTNPAPTLVKSRVWKATFTLGPSPDEKMFACQCTNIHVTPTSDTDGDPIKTACGNEWPAARTTSYVLGGTSLQDFDDPEGFLDFCFENQDTEVPFALTMNDVGAPSWDGKCTIVALEEGGDAGVDLTTDWEFDVTGKPNRTRSTGVATGATAGTPGTFTPAGSAAPANLAAMSGVTASPATAWTTGQHVVLADSSQAHWDGAAWATGAAA